MNQLVFRLRLLMFVLGGTLGVTNHTWAATLNAPSCSQSDVQTKINAASDGDIVTVPAGSCTWNSAVFITNKVLTLKGAGSGTGGTKITYGGTGHTLISIDAGSKTGKMDVSGFWLAGGDANYWGGTAMYFTGPAGWKNLRVHHMVFDNNKPWTIRGSAATHGLIDHCTFKGSASGISLDGRGDIDWSTPLVLGTRDFFFIEDNTFDWTDWYGNVGVPSVDFVNGGRIVFRHNNLKYGFFETHDKARSGSPSANAWEVYSNTFWTNTAKWKIVDVASGTGVIWGNTFNGPITVPIGAMDYKKTQYASHSNVKACNGSDPLDQNIPGQTGRLCQYQLGSQGQGRSAVSYPAYIWSNTVTGGSGSSGLVVTDGANNLQAGRDYFNNGSTPKPGYVPYTYPHPLTQGSQTSIQQVSIQPPSNLRRMQ